MYQGFLWPMCVTWSVPTVEEIGWPCSLEWSPQTHTFSSQTSIKYPKCNQCKNYCKSENELKTHIGKAINGHAHWNGHHQLTLFAFDIKCPKCYQCKNYFKSENELKTHIGKAHNGHACWNGHHQLIFFFTAEVLLLISNIKYIWHKGATNAKITSNLKISWRYTLERHIKAMLTRMVTTTAKLNLLFLISSIVIRNFFNCNQYDDDFKWKWAMLAVTLAFINPRPSLCKNIHNSVLFPWVRIW